MAEALDASATALAQLVQRERELVGDVSHQLRSRLTSLQLRIEELTVVPDKEVASEARAALEQAERLADVLDELMTAAREARAAGAMPVDLAAELPGIAEEWRTPLRAAGRSLKVRIEDGLYAKVSPGRLREVIGVLLDNALRHGSGTVTLSAREGVAASGGDTVVIEVTDMGTGVPDELAEHVFERGVSGGGSTGPWPGTGQSPDRLRRRPPGAVDETPGHVHGVPTGPPSGRYPGRPLAGGTLPALAVGVAHAPKVPLAMSRMSRGCRGCREGAPHDGERPECVPRAMPACRESAPRDAGYVVRVPFAMVSVLKAPLAAGQVGESAFRDMAEQTAACPEGAPRGAGRQAAARPGNRSRPPRQPERFL